MNHPTPKHLITTTTIPQAIEKHLFDFEVTFTIMGEVLEVNCPYWSLPKQAQNMMLGKDYQQVIERSYGLGKMMKYYFPMAALNLLKGEKWAEIRKQVTDFKQTYPEVENNFIWVKDKWVKTLYNRMNGLFTTKRLVAILAQLTSDNVTERFMAYRELRAHRSDLVGDFLFYSLRILTYEKEIKHCLETLEFYPNASFFPFLAAWLQDKEKKEYHPFIIAALTDHNHPEIGTLLLNYFKQNPDLSNFGQKKMVAILKFKHGQGVSELLYHFLVGKHTDVAVATHAVLISRGVSKEAISKMLKEGFLARPSANHLSTSFKMFDHLRKNNFSGISRQYFPNANELIDAMLWLIEETNSAPSQTVFKKCLLWQFGQATEQRLLDLLTHSNEFVVLETIRLMGDTERKVFALPLGQFLAHTRAQVSYAAIIALEKIMNKNQIPEIYPILVEFLDIANRRSLVPVVRIIKELFRAKEFPIGSIVWLIDNINAKNRDKDVNNRKALLAIPGIIRKETMIRDYFLVGKTIFITNLKTKIPANTLTKEEKKKVVNKSMAAFVEEKINSLKEKGFTYNANGLLFLDELTTAPPAVQAALLRVVLERKVGFHNLPKLVRIVAAANPPDLMAGGWELSPPLRNRFVHLQWDLPTSVYLEALEKGFATAELPEIDPKAHAEKLPEWKLLVSAFLKRSPNLLHTTPDSDPYAFASPRSWDFAGDMEINDSDWEGLKMPIAFEGIFPSTYRLPNGQIAEYYYKHIQKKFPLNKIASFLKNGDGNLPKIMDDGSGVHGVSRPWEVQKNKSKDGATDKQQKDSLEVEIIRRSVAQEMKKAQATGIGTIPGNWSRWVEEKLTPKVDWRKILRHRMSVAINNGVGSRIDYSYRKPNRRQYSNRPFVLPSLSGDMSARITVIVDTSGSMTPKQLAQCVGEVLSVLTVFQIPVTVIPCDARAYEPIKVATPNDFFKLQNLKGGGGTDMIVGIKAALDQKPVSDSVLVLTDGYTPYPEKLYKTPVVFGVLTYEGQTPALPPNPPWRGDRVVVIPLEL